MSTLDHGTSALPVQQISPSYVLAEYRQCCEDWIIGQEAGAADFKYGASLQLITFRNLYSDLLTSSVVDAAWHAANEQVEASRQANPDIFSLQCRKARAYRLP